MFLQRHNIDTNLSDILFIKSRHARCALEEISILIECRLCWHQHNDNYMKILSRTYHSSDGVSIQIQNRLQFILCEHQTVIQTGMFMERMLRYEFRYQVNRLFMVIYSLVWIDKVKSGSHKCRGCFTVSHFQQNSQKEVWRWNRRIGKTEWRFEELITWNEAQNTHEYHSQESEGGDPREDLLPPLSGHHVLYRGEEEIHI